MMTELEQKVFNTVAHISSGKALQKDEPTHALSIEIIKVMNEAGYSSDEVKAALNSLYRQGRITWGRTINDTYFRVKI